MSEYLQFLDGFAGLAALANGLLLWPIVRTLKADHKANTERLADHGQRLEKLEGK